MYFLGIGIVLLILKLMQIGPVRGLELAHRADTIRPGGGMVGLGRCQRVHQAQGNGKNGCNQGKSLAEATRSPEKPCQKTPVTRLS